MVRVLIFGDGLYGLCNPFYSFWKWFKMDFLKVQLKNFARLWSKQLFITSYGWPALIKKKDTLFYNFSCVSWGSDQVLKIIEKKIIFL